MSASLESTAPGGAPPQEPRGKRMADGIVIVLLVVATLVAMRYADVITAAFAPNPVSQSAESIARGRVLFVKHCQACHGAGGQGDGPMANALRKRPQDLTTLAPPPYFPDGVVAYRIANGGEVMPAWRGVLSASETWDVINYVRSLRR